MTAVVTWRTLPSTFSLYGSSLLHAFREHYSGWTRDVVKGEKKWIPFERLLHDSLQRSGVGVTPLLRGEVAIPIGCCHATVHEEVAAGDERALRPHE